MRWSSVLKKDVKPAAQEEMTVLSYVPQNFDFGTPEAALAYLEQKEQGSDFLMSDVLRVTTGVEEIEKQTEQNKIEEKVIEKISELQEDAYRKAYELGFAEGQQKAFAEKTRDLEQRCAELDQLLASLKQIKEEMAHQNEAHIMRMIFEIASRLAFDHVSQNNEVLAQLIKKMIEEAQAEENVNVLVAHEQLAFLEKLAQSNSREYDFLKKNKLEGSAQITVGGCVVETNYGVIDARMEERVTKLWNELKQSLPKVKSPIETT
jgi:flagellar assembly protein FliH